MKHIKIFLASPSRFITSRHWCMRIFIYNIQDGHRYSDFYVLACEVMLYRYKFSQVRHTFSRLSNVPIAHNKQKRYELRMSISMFIHLPRYKNQSLVKVKAIKFYIVNFWQIFISICNDTFSSSSSADGGKGILICWTTKNIEKAGYYYILELNNVATI